ncbi:MAG: HD domain-containing protein [Oscillospiraceae bacterium]|nr:HD domain-containing protein [Oscillospiraceae bacterium]
MINEPKKTDKNDFIKIFKEKITREGSDKLLEFLEKSDFFTAPASTRYHGAYEGGLLRHSLNVYECLSEYLARDRVKQKYELNVSEESAAIVALLHDICKVNFYTTSFRNSKNEQTGKWEKVPYYTINDTLPYGHGEKSVYMISGFMRLTRDEAMAIRWHMGFSGIEDKNMIGKALEMYPLAFALSVADMEASYFLEGTDEK